MSRVVQPDIQSLQRFYTFRKPEEVVQFLAERPGLAPVLVEIHDRIGAYFPSSPLALAHITDPEAPGEHHLVVYVTTDLASDAALDALDRFDEDWWLDNLDRADWKVIVDVESA